MRKVGTLVLLLAVAACGGTRASRELSRETLAQLVDYEEQVRGMSRSLQASYRQADADYAETLPNASQTEALAIEANLANDAADQTIADGFNDARLRGFVEAFLSQQGAQEAKYAELLGRLMAERDAALATTRRDEKELQAARTKLEFLQREPSLLNRAQQLQPLVAAGIGAIQEGQGDQP